MNGDFQRDEFELELQDEVMEDAIDDEGSFEVEEISYDEVVDDDVSEV